MDKIRKFVEKIKEKKGITGVDVASAFVIITLTVGIVTIIYQNVASKSKENIRYANATRIATNIMENIQKKPYEYLTSICDETYTLSGSSSSKVFDTKIPNGFNVTIIAKRSTEGLDVARDITIKVKYKVNKIYKTISINSVKKKEFMDMTNSPDLSLIPDYNPNDKTYYYYPVVKDGSDYIITSEQNNDWYNYEEGNYALICKTDNGSLNVGVTAPNDSTIYVWLPRYVSKTGSGVNNVQFLYGSSNYAITYNVYNNISAYGLKYSNTINSNSVPDSFTSDFQYTNFQNDDGLSGIWYQINGSYTVTDKAYLIAKELNSKITCINCSLPNY